MNQPSSNLFAGNRRKFLKSTSTAALGTMFATHFIVREKAFAANGDTLKVGLVGCGGRGSGAASQALHADSNVVLVAMGDAFEKQLKNSLSSLKAEHAEKVKVTPETSFTGLDAYKKVIDSGVDVVILATPPGFRPQHYEYAVEKGKHVFMEKPVATDTAGVKRVIAASKIAKEKKLATIAGFCWRYDKLRRQLFERVLGGDIGEVRASYHTYLAGPVKPMPPAASRPAGMGDVEWQIRNWYNFTYLGADGYTEQAVHSVDKLAWTMGDVPPIRCTGIGGRQVENHEGNIWDHIEVNYEYANGARGFVVHRQIGHCFGENKDYIMGSKGQANIGGRRATVEITGDKAWGSKEAVKDMYQVEHDELFASIRAGKPLFDGDRIWSSTLLALMGRMAAYTGQEISWEMMLESNEKLMPDSLAFEAANPVPPMAISGKYAFT
jgi:predicted dehydrogenase